MSFWLNNCCNTLPLALFNKWFRLAQTLTFINIFIIFVQTASSQGIFGVWSVVSKLFFLSLYIQFIIVDSIGCQNSESHFNITFLFHRAWICRWQIYLFLLFLYLLEVRDHSFRFISEWHWCITLDQPWPWDHSLKVWVSSQTPPHVYLVLHRSCTLNTLDFIRRPVKPKFSKVIKCTCL